MSKALKLLRKVELNDDVDMLEEMFIKECGLEKSKNHQAPSLKFDPKMYTLVTLCLIVAFLRTIWRHGDCRVEKGYLVTLYDLDVCEVENRPDGPTPREGLTSTFFRFSSFFFLLLGKNRMSISSSSRRKATLVERVSFWCASSTPTFGSCFDQDFNG